MNEKGKITAFSQHIIDTFRTWRSNEGISGREFSRRITNDNPTRVGNIESVLTNDKYSPTLIKKGLKVLGKSERDLFPDKLLDDDTLQHKTKTPILEGMSIRGALNSLWEEGYFDEERLRAEITAKYNSFFKPEEQKQDNAFSAQLEDMYNQGWLLKIENEDDKLIRFIKNPNFKLKEDENVDNTK